MTAIQDMLQRARDGRLADIGRLVSIVENNEPGAMEVIRSTFPDTGRAITVGFTGPPGAGKSTLVSILTEAYREIFPRVAVVAVDPSSPFTGGAILGDRIRMRDSYLDAGVFIRSMSNRGQSGGLARASRRVVNLLDALGYDVILVETVGVGQQEIDVVRLVDTVCLLTIPGAGDDIQAIKAGIIEIADLLVVNKCDRPGSDETVKNLTHMLDLGAPRNDWRTPVVKTSAAKKEGINELIEAVKQHREWSKCSGEMRKRNADAMRTELNILMLERLQEQLASRVDGDRMNSMIDKVLRKEVDPYSATEALLES